jgi:hypothetical protein
MRLDRNIALACGHDEALATLAQDQQTAWCPVCEARVDTGNLNCRACDGSGLDPGLALRRRAWEPWAVCAVCEGTGILPSPRVDIPGGA